MASKNNNKPNFVLNPIRWKQAKTVKKAVDLVDDFVKEMTHGAPFLAQSTPDPHIALLDRSEIQTGNMLGEGQFSQVYDVVGIHLLSSSTSKDNATAAAAADLSPGEQEARKSLQLHVKEGKTHRYAIKQPKRELLKLPHDFGKAIADLVVEALYLSRLGDHPNILSLHATALGGHTKAFDSGRFDAYFLVTDRLDKTLDHQIEEWQREGPPDPARIPRKTNYALQIANALLYLHKRRIIFRDLKPENVGLKELNGHTTIQLFDFGLCRELPQGFDNEMYAMSGSGSQWYMAVEIFLTGKYNLKADVYSWAVTTYEMLTESKPFAKMHKLEHVSMVCVRGKRPRLSSHNFPPALESVLRRSWGQSVSKRPNIKEVVRTLEELIPELGDEEACVWPTMEYNAMDNSGGENNDAKKKNLEPGATPDDDDLIAEMEAFLLGSDTAIDDEIRRDVHLKPTTYGDVEDDDNDYSMSFFSDH